MHINKEGFKRFLVTGTLICTIFLNAFSSQFSVKHFVNEDHFKGSFINDIIQDQYGYLWIATEAGLSKFNGIDFIDNGIIDSSKLTYPTSLCYFPSGDMIVGLSSGFVLKATSLGYDTLYVTDSSSSIVQLMLLDSNTIMGIDASFNAFFINKDLSSKKVVLQDTEDMFSAPSSIKRLNNELIVGTSEGLLVWDFDKSKDTLSFKTSNELLEFMNITCLEELSDNSLFIGTEDIGVWKYEQKLDGESEVIQLGANNGLTYLSVADILLVDNTHLWIGTKFEGVYSVQLNEQNSIDSASFIDHLSNEYVNKQISKLYEDSERGIWVASPGNGLNQINVNPFEFFELDSLGINEVYAVERLSGGKVLLATNNGLLHGQINTTTGNCVYKRIENTKEIRFTSIFKTEKDTIYVVTQKGQVYNFFSEKLIEIRLHEPIEDQDVSLVSVDGDGNIWLILDGWGAVSYYRDGSLRKRYDIPNGFITKNIKNIYHDRQGFTWFATHIGGLVKETPDGELLFLSKEEKFPFVDINNIAKYNENVIIMGTSGSGLLIIEGDSLSAISENEGLYDNNIISLEIDDKNNIWAFHRKGVSRIDLKSDRILTFSSKEGVTESGALLNSSSKDEYGNIWIGHRHGVTWLHSPVDNFESTKFPTFFTSVLSNNKGVKGFETPELKMGYSNAINLFPYDKNNFSFEFAAISLAYPGRVKYEYILEGSNSLKSSISSQNRASYNNLSPGDYSFKVITYFNNVRWNTTPIQYKFKIDKPYWDEWWFYLGQITVFVMLAFFTFRIGVKGSIQWARLILYITLFVAFDYVEVIFEMKFKTFTGSAPIFQVLSHLVLAVLLFPIEGYVKRYFKSQREKASGPVEFED